MSRYAPILWLALWPQIVVALPGVEQPVEGFARLVWASNEGEYGSNRGTQVASSWEYAQDGTQAVVWESAPVPQGYTRGFVTFAWSCGLARQEEAHGLYLNDVKILSFRGVPPRGGVLSFGKVGGEFKPVAADGEAGLIPFNGTEEAMSGWRIFVYGTQGSAGENRAARETAERLAAQPRTVDITFPVKADTAITAEDIERASLILLGTPASNAVLARIEDQLPVRFGDDGITLGGKTYDGEDRLVVLVYPNPLRPDRYVVILGATSPGAYDGVHGLGWGHPDYSIRDAKGEAIVEGNFDIAWQPANN